MIKKLFSFNFIAGFFVVLLIGGFLFYGIDYYLAYHQDIIEPKTPSDIRVVNSIVINDIDAALKEARKMEKFCQERGVDAVYRRSLYLQSVIYEIKGDYKNALELRQKGSSYLYDDASFAAARIHYSQGMEKDAFAEYCDLATELLSKMSVSGDAMPEDVMNCLAAMTYNNVTMQLAFPGSKGFPFTDYNKFLSFMEKNAAESTNQLDAVLDFYKEVGQIMTSPTSEPSEPVETAVALE